MNFILKYQLLNPDKYLLLDSDMFLIADLDIAKYLDYECAIVLQSRNDCTLQYMWNGIYYFNIPKMKNLELMNWNEGFGGDVGAMMAGWLKAQMVGVSIPSVDDLRWKKDQMFYNLTVYFIRHLWSCSWDLDELPPVLKVNEALVTFLQEDPRNVNGKFFCEIYDGIFLHYRAGGNWNGEGMTLHNALTARLKEVLLSRTIKVLK